MKPLLIILALYLLLINLDAFLLMRSDKRRAQRGGRRVPEAAFFLLAVLGGAPGVLLAMYAFRHKTRHAGFAVGMPVICFFEAALILAAIIAAAI